MKIQSSEKKLLFIATGGTGGHIFPSQVIAKTKRKSCKVFLTFDRRAFRYTKCNKISFYKFVLNNAVTKNKKHFDFVKKSVFYEPSLVLTFGNYAVIIVLIYAIVFDIPFILHEQNVIFGQINNLSVILAVKQLLSFPTYKIQDNNSFVGLPNNFRYNIKERNIKKTSALKVLIVGGSQGAAMLNESIFNIIKDVCKIYPGIIHITEQIQGGIFKDAIKSRLKLKNFNINTFFKSATEIYKNNDIVISRAGASSITELFVSERVFFLLPYYKAKDNHQLYNSRFLRKNSMFFFQEERKFSKEWVEALFLNVLIYPKIFLLFKKTNLKKFKHTNLNSTSRFAREMKWKKN